MYIMKKLFIILIFAFLAIPVFSQGYTSFTYSMGFGTGDMHDYISKASFRGFTIDYRKLVRDNVGVGMDIGWNVFYQEMPDAVYENGNIVYSGKQWRYSNHFPMLAAVDYYKTAGDKLTILGGLGLGTMYTLQNTDMNVYTWEKEAWHFVLRPELGVMFSANPDLNLTITSKYYYGFKAGDLPAQGFFTINVGLVFVN